jgi:hypothetical protein
MRGGHVERRVHAPNGEGQMWLSNIKGVNLGKLPQKSATVNMRKSLQHLGVANYNNWRHESQKLLLEVLLISRKERMYLAHHPKERSLGLDSDCELTAKTFSKV